MIGPGYAQLLYNRCKVSAAKIAIFDDEARKEVRDKKEAWCPVCQLHRSRPGQPCPICKDEQDHPQ